MSKLVFLTNWQNESKFKEFWRTFKKTERKKFNSVHIRKRTLLNGIIQYCIVVKE